MLSRIHGRNAHVRTHGDLLQPKERDRAEVQAKIVIDIYMTHLVDFCTILKILDVVSRASHPRSIPGGSTRGKLQAEVANPVVVACYMGALHTRAVEAFFCDEACAKRGDFSRFRSTHMFGKLEWEEDEARRFKVPADMFDLTALF